MTDAPTPRTDAEPGVYDGFPSTVSRDFARTLERDLAAANERAVAAERERDAISQAAHDRELGYISQRDEARRERDEGRKAPHDWCKHCEVRWKIPAYDTLRALCQDAMRLFAEMRETGSLCGTGWYGDAGRWLARAGELKEKT